MLIVKWWRPRLSLAAKCRIGFAVAVLLIIGTALYFPYRWMEKLLEQSKRELALAEVQHVLSQHFHAGAGAPGESLPSLVMDVPEQASLKVEPWAQALNPITQDPNKNLSKEDMALRAAAMELAKPPASPQEPEKPPVDWRPVARWIPLSGLGLENPSEGMDAEVETGSAELKLPVEDVFVRRGVNRFLRHPARVEEFVLHDEFATVENLEQLVGLEGKLLRGLGPALLWSQPSHYLRAVRANAGCSTESCHGGKASVPGVTVAPTVAGKAPRVFSEGELVGVVSVLLPVGQTAALHLFNFILIVVAGLLAGICAMVTFYLITQRFILEPVRRLRRAADTMTIPLEESAPAPPPEVSAEAWQYILNLMDSIRTGDEYERLAQAFHHLLERLKMAQDRLRESNRALDVRLDELQTKNVALFESNKLKSEFLANVSHELRTPLNAIIGFAELVRDQAQATQDDKTTRYSSNVLESGKLLLSIVNNLLDLAKIEAAKVEIRCEPCSVQEITETLVSLTRPLAEGKKLAVNVYVDPQQGLVMTDPGKLQQILFNLLSNAIKFTPAGGQVDIAAGPTEGEMFYISVADTGPGIAEADRQTIFEKFRQLDSSITREHPGTGLGLAIVKELVTILGGAVTVGGEVGQGAVFTVTLPARGKANT